MKERILGIIRREGPLPFERFMELALYHPAGGYYSAGPLRSRPSHPSHSARPAGDFITSPEVSPAFGETLAAYALGEYRRLGEPAGFTVAEAGAASGALLEPLLAALPFPARAEAVEASAAARAALAARLPRLRVHSPEEVPARLTGVMFANEVADNLPVALAVREGDGWSERRVGEADGELTLVAAPVRAEVGEWLDSYAGEVPEGGTAEAQLAARDWISEWAGRLAAGSLAVIDYGPAGEADGRGAGTLRTHRRHRPGPHPLDSPGEADITVDVNFAALVDAARAQGLECETLTQRAFLTRCGLPDRLAVWREEELELARAGEHTERLRARSRITGAAALLDPAGLGGFQVLIARRPAPPAPDGR